VLWNGNAFAGAAAFRDFCLQLPATGSFASSSSSPPPGATQSAKWILTTPTLSPATVTAVYRDEVEVGAAAGGENLRLRLAGVEEDDVAPGFVVCSRRAPVPVVTAFDAQLQVLDLLEHKAVFTAGYKAVLHVHSVVEECEITALLAQVDVRTKAKKKAKFVKGGSVVIARVSVEKPAAAGAKINRPSGPVKHGSTVIAFIEDPDGYKIELIQR
jgi:peptide chain release factor subunit 3